jgi:hypothetical protein
VEGLVDVYTKEEIIGAVFSAKTTNGAEMGVDYLPKVQARKLYQYAQERTQAEREARRLRELEEKRAESGSVNIDHAGACSFSSLLHHSLLLLRRHPTPPSPAPV